MSRKKEDFLRREQLIISEAAHLLQSEGYFGLSLDKLASAIGCAKGTLYQHFRTKEDIVLAIAAQSMQERSGLFLKAAAFDARARERICALTIADQLFVKLFPGHFQVEHLIKSRSLWAKTSPIRQRQLEKSENKCGESVLAIIDDAVASGDLALREKKPAEVALGLWTMSLGIHTLVFSAGLAGDPDLPAFGITDPYLSLWRNQLTYLDGLGWRPLSSELDYEETRKTVLEEIFDEEWNTIQNAS